MKFAFAFIAYFLLVTLKAFQQRQVQHAEYKKMPPISYGMTMCEVFLMANVARTADSELGLFLLALCMGTGASLGGILGTWLHARNHT